MTFSETVELVAERLMDGWFPDGHPGETDRRLEGDLEAWQHIAGRDALWVVQALVDADLLSFAEGDMVE